MASPVKCYSLGKIQAAIFENEYQGKKSYSVKFSKSYKDQQGNWKNTDSFYLNELRDLYGLIGCMLDKQVKERTPGQQPQQQQYTPQQVADELDNFTPQVGEVEVPF